MKRRFVTIVKDKYGYYHDLRFSHPSWEEEKKGSYSCTAVNAFMWSEDELYKLKLHKPSRTDIIWD